MSQSSETNSSQPSSPASPLAEVHVQRLSLVKGEHRWEFAWDRDSAASMMNHVAQMARDPELAFDWYDAAIICKHIVGIKKQ